jgi:pimeloyl-ACP methyl ester carboxylesterase
MSIPHPWQRRRHARVLLSGTYQLVAGGPFGKLAMQRLGFARLILKQGRTAGAFSEEELDTYDAVQRQPDAAAATVRIYRSFMLHELAPWANGRFKAARLTVPTLWLSGENDPLASVSDDGYRDHADDMTLEFLPGASHFLPEELPQTVRDRVLAFL